MKKPPRGDVFSDARRGFFWMRSILFGVRERQADAVFLIDVCCAGIVVYGGRIDLQCAFP